MISKNSILIPEATYHIYNRANGNEKLFVTDENYLFFLKKYNRYIKSLVHTFSYCLMPNHFHFLIRIKSEKELTKLNLTGFENLSGLSEEKISNLLTRQFSHFFNGYAKAINKQENRKGSLFMRPFKRIRIMDDHYLKKLVHYIHFNPVEAGFCKNPEDWIFSSYPALSGLKTATGLDLLKDEVLGWFGDRENFIYCHRFPPKETGIELT